MGKNGFKKHFHRKQDSDGEEIFVDKDGIPHWDGLDLTKLDEYESRVECEYDNLGLEVDEEKRKPEPGPPPEPQPGP